MKKNGRRNRRSFFFFFLNSLLRHPQITSAQLLQFSSDFSQLDDNGDSVIDHSEYVNFCKRHHLPVNEKFLTHLKAGPECDFLGYLSFMLNDDIAGSIGNISYFLFCHYFFFFSLFVSYAFIFSSSSRSF
jgi:hypothetical protein